MKLRANKIVIIIGGGASGVFTAIQLKEFNPDLDVLILEKSNKILQKVKISGGGRCNITNATELPQLLTKAYPRGNRELLGPFHQFGTSEMKKWLLEKGLTLKTEKDGRVFPTSNSSQSVLDLYEKLMNEHNVRLELSTAVHDFEQLENNQWEIKTSKGDFFSDYLVISAGSSKPIWNILKEKGFKINSDIPSLFTFNTPKLPSNDLMGNSVDDVVIRSKKLKLESRGPLLFTHWGLSGPAVLKFSAFGAIKLFECNYQFDILIDFLPNHSSLEDVFSSLTDFKLQNPNSDVLVKNPFGFSRKIWNLLFMDNQEKIIWQQLPNKELRALSERLKYYRISIDGKSTFKEEFVTAGGVHLKQINTKSFESKNNEKLYFTGEVLNIDAITGGYNFQAAWTTGFLAAQDIAKKTSN